MVISSPLWLLIATAKRDVEAIDSFVYDRVWLRGSIFTKGAGGREE
jgi:hypothetical protein